MANLQGSVRIHSDGNDWEAIGRRLGDWEILIWIEPIDVHVDSGRHFKLLYISRIII